MRFCADYAIAAICYLVLMFSVDKAGDVVDLLHKADVFGKVVMKKRICFDVKKYVIELNAQGIYSEEDLIDCMGDIIDFKIFKAMEVIVLRRYIAKMEEKAKGKNFPENTNSNKQQSAQMESKVDEAKGKGKSKIKKSNSAADLNVDDIEIDEKWTKCQMEKENKHVMVGNSSWCVHLSYLSV